MEKEIDGQKFFNMVSDLLDERTTRLVASAAALGMRYGGISQVSRFSGLSRPSIYAGIKELKSKNALSVVRGPRQRKLGGGRKSIGSNSPELLEKLDGLIKPYEFGNPESPLRWTSRSLRKLSGEMKQMGYNVSHMTVGKFLQNLGYTLQSNKKSHESGNSPDRDAQFEHINETATQFGKESQPIISVDAKKKELVGEFKNNGQEYRPAGNPEKVNVYDFIDPTLGRATPYGVYDLNLNEGFVSVGISHDTAQFAVETIEKWWLSMGREKYEDAHSLFITADGGGSNGSRNRLWKKQLQNFADKYGLNIYVSHFPPGTSKWNKIEHRMFSAISMNWRGKPLVSLEVIVNLIAGTTTRTGLKIKAVINRNEYKLGEKVQDKDFAELNIRHHEFHPEWNYAIMHR
jgi:predicted DNA-binding transcriptional regulator AlpA